VARTEPFEENVQRYEAWYDRCRLAYESELAALGALLPAGGKGVEVGVGTGRFAAPLGVRFGVEPSPAMGRLAAQRGVRVCRGAGEALPLRDGAFDVLTLVVTVCFLDDVFRSFCEAGRVLAPGGHVLVGFIDRSSALGRAYEAARDGNVFYRQATFFAAEEILFLLSEAGFGDFACRQTVFRHPAEMRRPDPATPGYGEGSFVVVRGRKQGRPPAGSP